VLAFVLREQLMHACRALSGKAGQNLLHKETVYKPSAFANPGSRMNYQLLVRRKRWVPAIAEKGERVIRAGSDDTGARKYDACLIEMEPLSVDLRRVCRFADMCMFVCMTVASREDNHITRLSRQIRPTNVAPVG
jgi:hypothetical protein